MKLSSFVGGSFSVCVLLESVCGGAVCRGVLAAYPPHCARGPDDMRVGSAAHAHIQRFGCVFSGASASYMPGRAPLCPTSRPPQWQHAGYRTKRVGFVVTFRLVSAEKSVLKLVRANLKDGQNVLVL